MCCKIQDKNQLWQKTEEAWKEGWNFENFVAVLRLRLTQCQDLRSDHFLFSR